MNNGYIKIHRLLLKWEWYDDANTFRLFIHLILKANHKEKNWHGIVIKRGEVLTGRIELSKQLHLTPMQIRTSLNKLKATSEITIKTTNKYSIIALVSYNKYQESNQQDNQQVTNKQPTSNQQVTTTNELKKEKKEKKYKEEKTQLEIAIDDFVKHRKVNKHIMTERSLVLFKNKLSELAKTDEYKIELIDYAIAKNWRTVFEKPTEKKNEVEIL